jgi:hypothetical protein
LHNVCDAGDSQCGGCERNEPFYNDDPLLLKLFILYLVNYAADAELRTDGGFEEAGLQSKRQNGQTEQSVV